MKIEVNEDREIILKEVFSGVGFKSPDGEELGVCMRDSGYEVMYGGRVIRLNEGEIEIMHEGAESTKEDAMDNGGA